MPIRFTRLLLEANALFFLLQGCAVFHSLSPSATPPAAPLQPSSFFEARKKHPVPAGRVARNVFIGQIYPSGAIYLDVLDDREAGTKRWPKTVKVFPLQGQVTSIKSAPLSATLIGPLEQVYPPEVEAIAEKSADCSAPSYHQDFGLSYESTEPDQLKDYFDRGVKNNCSAYTVGKYWTSDGVTRSFPVFALGDYEGGPPDYSVHGQSRPLTSAEKREVAQYHLADDPDEDATDSHSLEAAKELVQFDVIGTGWTARLSTFQSERGDQRSRTFVLDIVDNGRVRKRRTRTLSKGTL